MKITLAQYMAGIRQKTLMVFCNDCFCAHKLEANDNIIVHTQFGNMFTNGKCDTEYLEHCVTRLGVKRIVVAGHYCCGILRFLYQIPDTENTWQEAAVYVKHLVAHCSKHLNGSSDGERRLMLEHISQQIENLLHTKGLREYVKEGKLAIHGIVVNDARGNEVEGVDLYNTIAHKLCNN